MCSSRWWSILNRGCYGAHGKQWCIHKANNYLLALGFSTFSRTRVQHRASHDLYPLQNFFLCYRLSCINTKRAISEYFPVRTLRKRAHGQVERQELIFTYYGEPCVCFCSLWVTRYPMVHVNRFDQPSSFKWDRDRKVDRSLSVGCTDGLITSSSSRFLVVLY